MGTAAAAKPVDLIRPTVLVVDDQREVLDALQSLLAPRLEPLYRVETAASAEEALELVAANEPESTPIAAVISDEKMPGRSGTDLLIALRQSPAHRHGGRMIITAYAGLASAKKAINEAEVARYYPKPWDAEGKLLPALGEILESFARRRGLDRFLVAEPVNFTATREAIIDVRRAWWEYITLMGLSAAEAGVEEPAFIEAADAGSTHFIVTRRSPNESTAVASIRLEPGAGGGPATLAGLAFRPEEANQATESLLLRAALLHARHMGTGRVRVDAPVLRRDVYEALGFAAAGALSETSPAVAMDVQPSEAKALDGPMRAFETRWSAESRLCECAQVSCPSHDYAAARRGYFCPLDLAEGRLPAAFPGTARP
jgi:CheY-like chemotaxis protein